MCLRELNLTRMEISLIGKRHIFHPVTFSMRNIKNRAVGITLENMFYSAVNCYATNEPQIMQAEASAFTYTHRPL